MKTIQCLLVDDEPLALEVITAHIEKIPGVAVATTSSDAMGALFALHQQPIDLIFLDINMPEINGLEFLKSLPQRPPVVLTTAYRNHALEAFDLNVLDYLVKPVAFPRLLQAVQKFFDFKGDLSSEDKSAQQTHPVREGFFVRSEKKNRRILFEEIRYAESQKDYLTLHLKNGDEVVTKMTLVDLTKTLPSESFLRIHRSFIIALAEVRSFNHEEAELKGVTLPIGRSYQQQALQVLKSQI